MKKSVSVFIAFVVVLAVLFSFTLPAFASAESEAVAYIIECFEDFVTKMTMQVFESENSNNVRNDYVLIEEETEYITQPQKEAVEAEYITQHQVEEQEIEKTAQYQDETTNETCFKYIYGSSEMELPLEAFIIDGYGANDKIIFMDFAVHGFEDEYANDGKVLVDLGYSLVDYYTEHPENLGDYRMVIVPCANPDGVIHGVNDKRSEEGNAFGRCTYSGIDMNRDFKEGCFYAVESQALKSLMDEYTPDIYINFHGWEDSVLGDPDLVRILVPSLHLSRGKADWYRAEDGFIMGFVKEHYGAKAALVEFKDSYSVYENVVTEALAEIMENC